MSEQYVINEYLPLLLTGTVSNEGERQSRKLTLMTLGDGTLRNWGIVVGRDATGRERPVLMETTREMGISLHGEDPSGDIVGLRTDEQRLLRTREYEPRRGAGPTQLTVGGGATTIYTAAANTIADVTLIINAVGQDTARLDLTVQGQLAIDNMIVPCNMPPLELPMFRLGAAATIIGQVVVGIVNVFKRVELWSLGDTNTGV